MWDGSGPAFARDSSVPPPPPWAAVVLGAGAVLPLTIDVNALQVARLGVAVGQWLQLRNVKAQNARLYLTADSSILRIEEPLLNAYVRQALRLPQLAAENFRGGTNKRSPAMPPLPISPASTTTAPIDSESLLTVTPPSLDSLG